METFPSVRVSFSVIFWIRRGLEETNFFWVFFRPSIIGISYSTRSFQTLAASGRQDTSIHQGLQVRALEEIAVKILSKLKLIRAEPIAQDLLKRTEKVRNNHSCKRIKDSLQFLLQQWLVLIKLYLHWFFFHSYSLLFGLSANLLDVGKKWCVPIFLFLIQVSFSFNHNHISYQQSLLFLQTDDAMILKILLGRRCHSSWCMWGSFLSASSINSTWTTATNRK